MPVSQAAIAPASGLIIAAPTSGSGKTVLTLGLLRLLARRGVAVASAKVGPDYIDPAFHTAALAGDNNQPRTACVNLDPWAMRPATLAGLAQPPAPVDLVVAEGVMGLFDGALVSQKNLEADELDAGSAPDVVPDLVPDGSTAHLAQLTGWPVILIVDARAQAGSAAAVVRGFAGHRAGVRVAGVVFNRVGGPAHKAIVEDATAAAVPDVRCLGAMPRVDELELPARHLGLVQALEHPDLAGFLDRAADLVDRHVDVDGLLDLATPSRLAPAAAPDVLPVPLPPLGQRIAVARDQAFAFAYPSVLSGWRNAGAQITLFSPLADQAPARDADAIYLPGGYPELHAGVLAGNRNFLAGLCSAADRGTAVFGECGGYMVLGDGLTDADGVRHPMAGLLGLETSFAQRRLHLGYRRAQLNAAGPLGAAGAGFRGHEFHYATVVAERGDDPLFAVTDAAGRDLGAQGLVRGRVAGSFVHLIDQA